MPERWWSCQCLPQQDKEGEKRTREEKGKRKLAHGSGNGKRSHSVLEGKVIIIQRLGLGEQGVEELLVGPGVVHLSWESEGAIPSRGSPPRTFMTSRPLVVEFASGLKVTPRVSHLALRASLVALSGTIDHGTSLSLLILTQRT